MLDEGMENRVERHRELSYAVREAAKTMGLTPYPRLNDKSKYSNAISVLKLPERIDSKDVVSRMEERGVLIRQGLGGLTGNTIRIGTMGDTTRKDVVFTIEVLRDVLESLSMNVKSDGVDTAKKILNS
jgi:aspartate aminotransferase-like enzyme